MSDQNQASNPVDLVAQAKEEFDDLLPKLSLGDAFEEIQELAREIANTPQEIQSLRSRGYVYGGHWEATIADIKEQWPQRKRTAEKLQATLKEELDKTRVRIKSLLVRSERVDGLEDDIQQGVKELEQQVDGAVEQIRAAILPSRERLSDLSAEMAQVSFLLDEIDAATFDLLRGEHGISAVRAEWIDHDDKPEGILFLTNQRIIFELEEKVAKKKFLFITTESETVQRVTWQAPLGAVEEVKAEDKGGFIGFGVKEMVTLHFNSSAREAPRKVDLRFKEYADNEGWQATLKQVKTGQYEQTRYNPDAPVGVKAGGEAAGSGSSSSSSSSSSSPSDSSPGTSGPVVVPTVCPSCKASLPPVVKGATSVTCEYCGTRVAVPV